MLTLATMLFFTHKLNDRHQVQVLTCNGKYARLFVDAKMTMPMANPFIPQMAGYFRFYTPSTCLQIDES